MVKKSMADMSLTGNGLRDWLVQRFSSVIIGLYFLTMVTYILLHPHLNYPIFRHWFFSPLMQVFSLVTLLSIFLHAWVGVWTVITDYIKPIPLRLFLQVSVILLLTIYFFWGVAILARLV